MGLNKFIRARKQVKADRAESGSHQKLVAALGANGGSVTPSVVVIPDELFGKKRIKSLSKPGSHTYSNKTEEERALINKNKRPAKDENNGN
jgi:hypothetical protein